jgi:hypothetical protein
VARGQPSPCTPGSRLITVTLHYRQCAPPLSCARQVIAPRTTPSIQNNYLYTVVLTRLGLDERGRRGTPEVTAIDPSVQHADRTMVVALTRSGAEAGIQSRWRPHPPAQVGNQDGVPRRSRHDARPLLGALAEHIEVFAETLINR